MPGVTVAPRCVLRRNSHPGGPAPRRCYSVRTPANCRRHLQICWIDEDAEAARTAASVECPTRKELARKLALRHRVGSAADATAWRHREPSRHGTARPRRSPNIFDSRSASRADRSSGPARIRGNGDFRGDRALRVHRLHARADGHPYTTRRTAPPATGCRAMRRRPLRPATLTWQPATARWTPPAPCRRLWQRPPTRTFVVRRGRSRTRRRRVEPSECRCRLRPAGPLLAAGPCTARLPTKTTPPGTAVARAVCGRYRCTADASRTPAASPCPHTATPNRPASRFRPRGSHRHQVARARSSVRLSKCEPHQQLQRRGRPCGAARV